MQLKIELDNFWLDEDDELEPALKRHIINVAVKSVSESIEQKIDKQITAKVNTIISSKLEPIIDTYITELMETETITVNKNPVSIKAHLKDIFQNNQGWRNPKEQIVAYAKKFGEDMKHQYNAAFANQIVANLKEQGMLKDEVVNALLAPPKK